MAEEDILRVILANQEKQDARLANMEQAIVTIARIDERQANQRDVLARYGMKIDDHDRRLDDLERSSAVRGPFFRWLERLGLVGAGGVLAKLIAMFPGGS
jgi:hypothetical protein